MLWSVRARGSGPRDGAIASPHVVACAICHACLALGCPAPFGPKPRTISSRRPFLPIHRRQMAKRSHSPAHLPPAKRSHLSTPSESSTCIPPARSDLFESLYDELILHIFTFLSYTDLCALQTTNRNLARLSLDNQVHNTFIPEIFMFGFRLNIRDVFL